MTLGKDSGDSMCIAYASSRSTQVLVMQARLPRALRLKTDHFREFVVSNQYTQVRPSEKPVQRQETLDMLGSKDRKNTRLLGKAPQRLERAYRLLHLLHLC
jgi:hypothetical protein